MKRKGEPEIPPMFDYWDRKLAAVAGPDVARVQQQNRALEHERQAGRTTRKARSKILQGRVTLTDIGRLIQHRHNGPCDTDEGETYLKAALPWLVEEAGGFHAEMCDERVQDWVRVATPGLTEAEVCACLDEASARDARGRLYWPAQDLGDLLCLTVAEREGLGITKARPHGMNDRRFEAYQRSRKTAAEKARRIAAGAVAREQSEARLEPWKALGISRRTFYRLKEVERAREAEIARGTNLCPPDTKYLKATTGQCHEESRPLQVPARQASLSRVVGAGGHSPSGRVRPVAAGHAVALLLPVGGIPEQMDLPGMWVQVGAPVAAVVEYLGGIMPPELILAVKAAQRARNQTQETVAHHAGVSRPQLANAMQQRFGLSRSAAANLMRWLEAA